MDNINDQIQSSVRKVVTSPAFNDWLNGQSLAEDDILIINNSFIYRDAVDTIKSDHYLAMQVDEKGNPALPPYVIEWSRVNSDFKHISSKSHNFPELINIEEAIKNEVSNIGELPFVLIGSIDDTIVLKTRLQHSVFNEVIWDPSLEEDLSIDDDKIHVSEVADEPKIWDLIVDHYTNHQESPPDNLRDALGDALDNLLKRARANLILPSGHEANQPNMTSDIVRVLEGQRETYQHALSQMGQDEPLHENSLNEILRIAYSFSSDATNFLRLVISICDLKPIVLWGTINHHFSLINAFRSLPWTSSKDKPSINGYNRIIGDARNSAFHDLFPFRKTLSVKLPPSSLRDVNLTFFSEFTNRSGNELIYKDKELVEVLLKFTRARERKVTNRFWTLNLDVMDEAISLFSETGRFLSLINQSSLRT